MAKLEQRMKIGPQSLEVSDGIAHKGLDKISKACELAAAFVFPERYKNARKVCDEADRHSQLQIAQNSNDIKALQNGELIYQDGELKAPSSRNHPVPLERELITAALQSAIASEVKRQITFSQVIEMAENIVSQEPQGSFSDTPIDPDWFESFRAHAEKTTNESLKRKWAQVLAGEAKSPGTFSLRTFNFIAHLSQKEATLVNSLASLAFGSVVPITQNTGQFGLDGFLSLTEVLELETMGLISVGGGNLSSEWDVPSGSVRFLRNQSFAISITNKNNGPISMRCNVIPLTTVGQNVVGLIDDISPNVEFCEKIFGHLLKMAPPEVTVEKAMIQKTPLGEVFTLRG